MIWLHNYSTSGRAVRDSAIASVCDKECRLKSLPSLLRGIDHVVNYLKFPKGGVWLQELVTIYKPSYLSYISAFGDAEISFKQFIEDNIHRMKEFQGFFPEQKVKDIFWKMIDLLSDELNKVWQWRRK